MTDTHQLLTAALAYAAHGWAVFPCRGKQPWIAKNAGGQGYKDATVDAEQIRQWWTRWPTANIGLATGQVSGVFVLDLDAHKGGRESLDDLERSYHPLPDTVQALTRNGAHYYFRPGTTRVPPSAQSLGAGLDIRGDGGYVILPPSRHPRGGRYEWELSSDPEDVPVADAPAWLLALVEDDPPLKARRPPSDRAITPVPIGPILAGCAWLRHCHDDAATLSEPAWYGSLTILGRCDDGDALAHQWSQPYPRYRAVEVDAKLRHAREDSGPLSCHTIRASYDGETYCSTCPQWGQIASPISLANIARRSRNGQPPPSSADDPVTTPWRDFLLTKKNGDPTMNVSNIGLILANHEAWVERFWWDAVHATPMLDEAALTDEDITRTGQWLGIHERMAVAGTKTLGECILAECKKRPKDLLQHWLHALPPWDGVSRLDDWLTDVAGVAKDAYGMAVSRILPLSMVARAMEPGCLYRYVVILEGAEETGKSTLVRTLAGDGWYVELSMGLETKEAHMMLQGAWVAEMPELDSLTRTEETRLKAFITLKEDTWIPKYSNFKVSTPRRTIFIGTTNDESYLKGRTGNTRFLPIKTRDMDIAALRAMREQLFAEAFTTYQKAPGAWWRLPEAALAQADIERENRRVINVYEDDLAEWLNGRPEVTWQDIARTWLQIEPAAWKDKSMQMQIADALKILGYRKETVWRDGKTRKIWVWHRKEERQVTEW